MEKKNYFKIVREINKAVRAKGYIYHRCYTEPQKTSIGYRTKLDSADANVATFINKKFGNKVIAQSITCRRYPFYAGCWTNSVTYYSLVEIH